MPGNIVLSRLAESDLAALFDHIANDSGMDRAEIVLRRIEQTLQSLASWPLIGRVRTDLDGSPRVFALWPWVVIYEPLDNAEGICVLRVLDGRRDIPNVTVGQDT